MFYCIAVGVPVLTYLVVPRILGVDQSWRWLLLVACFTFFVSWYLPSPLIDGTETQFMTHFIGGGVFSGLLWLYIKLVKGWQMSWWLEAASLFALVSTLGVINELFEIVLYVTGGMQQVHDTSWDLLANSLGAGLVYVLYGTGSLIAKKRR